MMHTRRIQCKVTRGTKGEWCVGRVNNENKKTKWEENDIYYSQPCALDGGGVSGVQKATAADPLLVRVFTYFDLNADES